MFDKAFLEALAKELDKLQTPKIVAAIDRLAEAIREEGMKAQAEGSNVPEVSPAFLSEEEVLERACISRTTLWRQANLGTFPKPVRITDGPKGKKAWRPEDVQRWIDTRKPGMTVTAFQ